MAPLPTLSLNSTRPSSTSSSSLRRSSFDRNSENFNSSQQQQQQRPTSKLLSWRDHSNDGESLLAEVLGSDNDSFMRGPRIKIDNDNDNDDAQYDKRDELFSQHMMKQSSSTPALSPINQHPIPTNNKKKVKPPSSNSIKQAQLRMSSSKTKATAYLNEYDSNNYHATTSNTTSFITDLLPNEAKKKPLVESSKTEVVEETEFLESFHFFSDMIHKGTEVPGSIPINSSEDDAILEQLLDSEFQPQPQQQNHLTNKTQLSTLEESKEMHKIITSLKALSSQFQAIVHSVAGHRLDLARNLKHTNTTYIRLFERMLFIVLKLQRKREANLSDEMGSYKSQIQSMVYQGEMMQAQLIKLGEQNVALIGLNQSLRIVNDGLSNEVDELSKYRTLYYKQLEDGKKDVLRMEHDRRILENRLRDEEKAMLKRFHDHHKEMENEKRRMHEEFEAEKKAKEAKVPKTPIVIKKRVVKEKKVVKKESKDSDTQTEVTDEGLWDKQDGWVISTSDDVLAKALWRRAVRYASCPCCKGSGEFMKRILDNGKKKRNSNDGGNDSDDSVDDKDEVAVLKAEETKLVKKRARRSGTDEAWMLPDSLVEFLANLPKTIQAAQTKPKSWVCKEIHFILEEKHAADLQDEREGQQNQNINEFLEELFLKRYGLRRLAELNLFILIESIKECYKQSSLVHSFARFVGLIDEVKKKRNTIMVGKKGDDEQTRDLPMTNRYLDKSFLSAYLWTRDRLLQPYTGTYVYGTREREEGKDGSMKGVPTHIIIDKGTDFWVPLDRAVECCKLVLNFLSPKKFVTYSRQVEASAQLLMQDGRVSNPDGARMIIRSTMRNSMLNGNDKKSAKKEKKEEKEEGKDACQIVINMYDFLELVMEILFIRIHNVEDQLKRSFIKGDDNGDGVLSFSEFDALLKKLAPHFSERRILRMFREALTSGAESGFAIDKGTFATVCKNHGLVKLVDTLKLDKDIEEAERNIRGGRGSGEGAEFDERLLEGDENEDDDEDETVKVAAGKKGRKALKVSGSKSPPPSQQQQQQQQQRKG